MKLTSQQKTCFEHIKEFFTSQKILNRYKLNISNTAISMLTFKLFACAEMNIIVRSSHPRVFLGKGVLKICSKFTGEHPCGRAISIKLQSKFIEIALRHGCSPAKLLHIFRTPFPKQLY